MCTRPVELECRMESACETCSYFSTGPEFVPVLVRQRDHARDHHQPERADLFDKLISRANEVSSTGQRARVICALLRPGATDGSAR